jgi:hypothetical protein
MDRGSTDRKEFSGRLPMRNYIFSWKGRRGFRRNAPVMDIPPSEHGDDMVRKGIIVLLILSLAAVMYGLVTSQWVPALVAVVIIVILLLVSDAIHRRSLRSVRTSGDIQMMQYEQSIKSIRKEIGKIRHHRL